MADVGEGTKEIVSPAVEEALLPPSKRADEDAPVPATTDSTVPSEATEIDPDETRLPYATDPTPGAVTAMTPKTTKSQADKEYWEPIPVGFWVELGDTDAVIEQGGENAVGKIAYVTVSEKRLCTDPDCKMSPREHYHQAEDIPIQVRTRDAQGQTYLLGRDDFRIVTSKAHEVGQHG